MIEVVLADAELAFKPLSPVKFNIDRLETNPRFAAISRPANAAILVRLRIDMEDRGGNIELLLPYATIEPIRAVLLQMFMGEKFGRDPIWEGHLATEIGQAQIAVDAVLYEARLPLRQMMKLNVGDTLMLELKPDALVTRALRRRHAHRRPHGHGSATASPCASPSPCASRAPPSPCSRRRTSRPIGWRRRELPLRLPDREHGLGPAAAHDPLLRAAQQAAAAAQGRRAVAARDHFRADHRDRNRRARHRRAEIDHARGRADAWASGCDAASVCPPTSSASSAPARNCWRGSRASPASARPAEAPAAGARRQGGGRRRAGLRRARARAIGRPWPA